MAKAGTVTLELDANSVKLIRELQRASTQTRRQGNNMRRAMRDTFQSMRRNAQIAAAAIAGVATAATAAATQIMRTQAPLIDEMAKTSDALGIQLERMQALRMEADLNNVSSQQLTNSLRGMQRRLGEVARGGGTTARALADVGLSINDLINLPADQQLEQIALAMGRLENTTIRASVANDLFGRDALRMQSLLRSLEREGLQPTVDRIRDMGGAISRLDAARVEQMNDEMRISQERFSAMQRQFTVGMSTGITAILRMFNESATGVNDLSAQVDDIFQKVVINAVQAAAQIGQIMQPVREVVSSLWDGFTSLPPWAQELGVIGAILFGKKGFAVVAAVSAVSDHFGRIQERMFNARILGGMDDGDDEGRDFSIVAGIFGREEQERRDWDEWAQRTIAAFRSSYDDVEREVMQTVATPPTVNLPLVEVEEGIKEVEETAKESTSNMTRFGEEAAAGMQRAFADFLFDPFESGLKGMAANFARTLQRMMAEAASAQILGAIFGGMAGSDNSFLAGLGSAFGGTRDQGGRGQAGQAYVINPTAGPELFIPDSAGTFIPNADQGGMSITIDARDAGAEERIRSMIERQMVPQIIEASKQETFASMRRPRFA